MQSQAKISSWQTFPILYFLTDAIREVVVSGSTLVAEYPVVILLAGTLEVSAVLPLRHTDGETGLVLQCAVRVAGALLADRVVVVALGTGAAVLRSPESLLTLAQSVLGSAVARLSRVRAVTG